MDNINWGYILSNAKLIYECSNVVIALAFIAMSLKISFSKGLNIILLIEKQWYKAGILLLATGFFFLAVSLTDFGGRYDILMGLYLTMALFTWSSFFYIFYPQGRRAVIKAPNNIEEEISARYAIEEKLITKNKQLEWMERTAKICYGNWDINKNELIFSDGVENIIGIDAQQPLSFDELKTIIIPEDRIKIQRFLESITGSKGITSLLFRVIVDGKLKYVQMNAEIHIDVATANLIRGTFQDVTEEQMFLKKIEDKNEILKQIAWTQSHEVRGPLASMLGLISLYDLSEVEKEQNEFILAGLKETATALDDIIKKIVKKSESADVDLS